MKLKLQAIVFISLISSGLNAQTIHHFSLYSYNHALFNPAAAGAENKHVFGINGMTSGTELFDQHNFLSGTLSYNGHIAPINSGVGAIAIVDRLGIQNSSKIGISYNYKINLSEQTAFRIGIRPTLTKFTIDYNKYRDLNDPLIRKGKESSKKADLDAGIWFQSRRFYVGLTVNNLFDHKHSMPTDSIVAGDAFSNRSLTVIAGKKFEFKNIKLDPSIAVFNQQEYLFVTLNNNFTFYNLFVLGGTFVKSLNDYSDFYNVSVNGGIEIKDRFQVVGAIYTREHRKVNYKDFRYFEGMIKLKI
jgi:type IX secretion system PorP/SprF family membrane protein